MSSLGDVLELIFARADPAVSVHAVVRERCDRETAGRVSDRFAKGLERPAMPIGVRVMMVPAMAVAVGHALVDRIRRRPPTGEPAPESELTIWLEASGRARLRRTWETASGPEQMTAVVMMRLSTREPDQGMLEPVWPLSRTRSGHWPGPQGMDVDRLFSHDLLREIIAALELEELRDDEIAGRPVVVTRAVRRRALQLWPHWLPFGADSYELSFDRELGSLLSFRAFADGTVYADTTVTEITYGAPIDPPVT